MADQATNTNPTTTQPDAPEQPTTTASAETPQPTTGKTFTEAEVNAMIAARTSKLEKSLKAQFAEEAKTAAERAKLDEVERVKAEKADIEKRAQEAETRAVAAERRAALTGRVADPVAALKLLEDTHLDDEGNVLVDKLLEAYPFLAPQQDTKRVDLPGQKTMPGSKGDLRPDDFRGKSQAWIAANLHRLKSPQ